MTRYTYRLVVRGDQLTDEQRDEIAQFAAGLTRLTCDVAPDPVEELGEELDLDEEDA